MTGLEPNLQSEPHDGGESEQATVAKGKADETPVVALGATAVMIAILFILALGLAALAYVWAT